MLSRRDLVGRLAAGTAAALALGVARTGSASTRAETILPTDAGPTAQPQAVLQASMPKAPRLLESQAEALPASEASVATAHGAPPPWELLRPLAPGSPVAHGWRVADLSAVVHGACVLTLQNQRGRTHRVHLCRNDGSPQGLVYTERLDLVVMNGGRGDLPTEEGLAQAVAEVAHVLAANEVDRQQQPLVVALLPHAERLRRYAPGADARLR